MARKKSARDSTLVEERKSGVITEHDVYLMKEGTHARLYEKLGAHLVEQDGQSGTAFAVWAPNASEVSVMGDFNGWNSSANPLQARRDGSGIWEAFVPGAARGMFYKYHVFGKDGAYRNDRADPFAIASECPPGTSSRIWDLDYEWGDREWMESRRHANALDAPMSVYEVHLGSWRRVAADGNRSLSYRELADQLVDYVREMGFTHVELLPVMEHPFFGSWGYQVTGFFAASARYGDPQDLMYLIDRLHQYGIGVILDWVPSHFPNDGHGLVYFDGTYLYEHEDPRQGYHPEWKSCIFNYGRHEVRAFLLSSALFWIEQYHADGLRVDAVASMLYLDYGRREGEWIPNEYGGKENVAAIGFLRKMNELVYRDHGDCQTIAEESTAWPMVSRPTYIGGLGFGMKWNMGWMHDTLAYIGHDPIHRKYHHNQLTFSLMYAFHENFVLPLSHDEVVYGKRSLIGRMPGDDWQQFANLRLLYGYMWAHPGKKLLFMGGEFGQRTEWQHDGSLDWDVLRYPLHDGLRRWMGDLNHFYRSRPAMYQQDFSPEGFEWIDCHNSEESVIAFIRKGRAPGDVVLVVCNFTPMPRTNYAVGVPFGGRWRECLNSDAGIYGGSDIGNYGGVEASPIPAHGRFHSLNLVLPPLGVVMMEPERGQLGAAGETATAALAA